MKTLTLFFIACLAQTVVFGQDITQTIRGTIIDKQSQSPIPGAKVMVVDSSPILAAITDFDGSFYIENVPVGR